MTQNFAHDILMRLLALSRNAKRVIMLMADILAIWLAFWLAFMMRHGEFFPPHLQEYLFGLPIITLISIPIFVRLGLYRSIVRYMDNEATLTIAKAVTLSVLISAAVLNLMGQWAISSVFPVSITLNFWFALGVLIFASRSLMRWFYQIMAGRRSIQHQVAIYGAGVTGAQLASALLQAGTMRPVAFFDDREDLHGSALSGIDIYAPDDLERWVKKLGISHVILAMPSVPRRRRQSIMQRLERMGVHIMMVPNMVELVTGEKQVQDIKEVEILDLLDRGSVMPERKLLQQGIQNKVVMVTGAGGSIGSELCRQIMNLKPKKLILFERSEFALYAIGNELKQPERMGVPILPVLGDVLDRTGLQSVMNEHKVNTIFHAAAYKHVPIVEAHPLEGVRNNIFGTQILAEVAIEAGVEKFVLVSTDKAVRPTNVMGATKRFAELVLQAYARIQPNTCFCMVRFGNVLDSSGSVVPLFRKQIRKGGPVTVTHKDVTRYFMTIPEAAQLVLQAGAMAKGGEVFILNMGQPVRIFDLAKKMIRLSGLSIKEPSNPFGDIEIELSGLRPGEKLHEELLLGDNVSGTEHKMIMQADEQYFDWSELKPHLFKLEEAAYQLNTQTIYEVLSETVEGFSSNQGLKNHSMVPSLEEEAESSSAN